MVNMGLWHLYYRPPTFQPCLLRMRTYGLPQTSDNLALGITSPRPIPTYLLAALALLIFSRHCVHSCVSTKVDIGKNPPSRLKSTLVKEELNCIEQCV